LWAGQRIAVERARALCSGIGMGRPAQSSGLTHFSRQLYSPGRWRARSKGLPAKRFRFAGPSVGGWGRQARRHLVRRSHKREMVSGVPAVRGVDAGPTQLLQTASGCAPIVERDSLAPRFLT
jgi:hypothetical protein